MTNKNWENKLVLIV